MDIETLTYAEALHLLNEKRFSDRGSEFEVLFFVEAVETCHEAKFEKQAFLELSLEKFYLCFNSTYQYFLYLFVKREACLSEAKLLQILRATIGSARRANVKF